MPYKTHLDSANEKKGNHPITNGLYMYAIPRAFLLKHIAK